MINYFKILNDFNFTEQNYIKEYLSQNVLSPKLAYFVSIKFSKIAIPYISVKDIIIQVEYQNKFYRYYVFSKSLCIYHIRITLKKKIE